MGRALVNLRKDSRWRNRVRQPYSAPRLGYPLIGGSYQLVGSSLMVRFANQLLKCLVKKEGYIFGKPVRHMGLCVSGQTVEDLLQRVQRTPRVHTGVVLMIGTNNAIRRESVKQACRLHRKLVSVLHSKGAELMFICTIPPIPKHDHSKKVKSWIRQYNKQLKQYKKV